MDRTVSECDILARMRALQKDYHATKIKLAEYKARCVEETERYDVLNVLQKVAERSDALIELQRIADIGTEGALICDGMMGTLAAFFGGEVMAAHRDAILIEPHFGSKGFHDMERLMQAVRHRVPVDVIEGGNLDTALQYGNHSSVVQHSDLLLDILMEDIASGRVLPVHRSIAHTICGLRISPLAVIDERKK